MVFPLRENSSNTMIAHYLINPDMRHNMDVLAETYLKYSPKSIETLIGKKGKNQKSMRDVALEDIKEYAAEDADITLQLKEVFDPKLDSAGTKKLFEEIEIPLIKVLADMEREGIRLDVEYLKAMAKDMDVEIKALEQKIYETAGETFNLASPKQLGDILFEKLKIGGAKQKKTKTGQYATGEEVLSYLANEHEIVQQILRVAPNGKTAKHVHHFLAGTGRQRHESRTYRLHANRSRYRTFEFQQSKPAKHSDSYGTRKIDSKSVHCKR